MTSTTSSAVSIALQSPPKACVALSTVEASPGDGIAALDALGDEEAVPAGEAAQPVSMKRATMGAMANRPCCRIPRIYVFALFQASAYAESRNYDPITASE